MNELILLKYGEIALKGLNKGIFEERLIKNSKQALKNIGKFKFYKAQSTLYAEPTEEGVNLDLALARLSCVFGYAGLCKAKIVEKDFEAIKDAAITYLVNDLESAKTFKVMARRADKHFPMDSMEISRDLGEYILEKFPHLKVDVKTPEIIVVVEIRDFAAYVHRNQLPGAGGLPVGSSGKAALLLSGGIDSPVAGYMLAKRGVQLIAIHFASPPYTSDRSLLKVKELCKKMNLYCGGIRFYTVEFTKFQEKIRELCHEDLFTIIMRRQMMALAEIIATENECSALITGESVGQVASQTLASLRCTDAIVENMPVFRPLIGMDKSEIVKISAQIDTFETSILPFEDCCTVFTPKHPKTKAKLEEILIAEQALDIENLRKIALDATTKEWIG